MTPRWGYGRVAKADGVPATAAACGILCSNGPAGHVRMRASSTEDAMFHSGDWRHLEEEVFVRKEIVARGINQ